MFFAAISHRPLCWLLGITKPLLAWIRRWRQKAAKAAKAATRLVASRLAPRARAPLQPAALLWAPRNAVGPPGVWVRCAFGCWAENENPKNR